MSRDEAYLNAMLRELGAAYYQTLHGEGTASDMARAVDADADAQGRRDLGTEPGRSGASGDAGHHLGEETVTTQPSGEGERRIVVGVDGSVPRRRRWPGRSSRPGYPGGTRPQTRSPRGAQQVFIERYASC